MRNLRAFALLIVLLPATATAQAPANDPVEAIKAQYYSKFSVLPPSRKCTPDDAKGIWREFSVLEAGTNLSSEARKRMGDLFMAFGPYNTLFWQRSQVDMSRLMVEGALKTTKLQYIMTGAGMLYIYQGGSLQLSMVCLVSTEANKQYQQGQLLLALPIEKDKPLTITIYAPSGK